MRQFLLLLLLCFTPTLATFAQTAKQVVKVNRQRHFQKDIPAGDYSGIAWLSDNLYAVVCDKSEYEGFFIFQIDIDSIDGKIVGCRNMGFHNGNHPNSDAEGIAYDRLRNRILICSEADNCLRAYDLDGNKTGNDITLGDAFATKSTNGGLESLTFCETTNTFWTANENTLAVDGQPSTSSNRQPCLIRLQKVSANLTPFDYYFYQTDVPRSRRQAAIYAHGVSEVLALDDGSLLVLEREFRVPRRRIGSWVINKIYQVWPNDAETSGSSIVEKHLLCKWKTRLNLTSRSLANYEGMCLGPKLKDGSQVIVLVSDSQHQYKGVMKDWFKTVVIK